MKRCSGCRQTKSTDEFGRNKRTLDGFSCYCKECVREKNHAQYVANRERRIAEQTEYRAKNQEKVRQADRGRYESRKPWRAEYSERNRERLREQGRQFRTDNPGYHAKWRRTNPNRLAYERAHRETNRERYQENARRQAKANPNIRRGIKNRYRARKLNNGYLPYTAQDIAEKIAYWGYRCWICREPLQDESTHMDHVKPISRGGMDCLSNLRPACTKCNVSKGHRWPFNPREVAA